MEFPHSFLNAFSVQLSDTEYDLFADLIYRQCGINLGPHKKELVKGRLMKQLRSYQLKTFKEYYDFVLSDTTGKELEIMVNLITTNVTSFFREKAHFDFLVQTAFPAIVQRKNRGNTKRIRLWSAACSTGEEPYSILMTVLEYFKDPGLWDIKLLGTDISTRALVCAQQGEYPQQKVGDLSPLLLEKYYTKQLKDREIYYKIKDQVKAFSVFRQLNLMMEAYPFKGKFDIIFCRNVMIYFDKETQKKLVNRLADCLDEGGYFFVGHSEASVGMSSNLKKVGAAIFSK